MFFKIYAGLSGGFGGAIYYKTEEYDSSYEAEDEAHQLAVAEYESYEGCYGIISREDIREDLNAYGLDDNATEAEIEEVYKEEVEYWIDYWIEEADSLEDCEEG